MQGARIEKAENPFLIKCTGAMTIVLARATRVFISADYSRTSLDEIKIYSIFLNQELFFFENNFFMNMY